MMKMKKRTLSLVCSSISAMVIASSVSACSSIFDTKDSEKKACDALADGAREKLQAVLDAHQACSVDADCVTIEFRAGCFDSCSRYINAAGVSALDAATEDVNAAECAEFTADGCTFPTLPCPPPPTPACKAGRCVEGQYQ
jgi:hypothetical protein